MSEYGKNEIKKKGELQFKIKLQNLTYFNQLEIQGFCV